MTLEQLIARWGLPPQFAAELAQVLTGSVYVPKPDKLDPKSEAWTANDCRIVGGRVGLVTWRNNVGVLEDVTGRPVRYGLANESAAMNKVLKSGDDIGIYPHVVRPQDVGRKLGVFVSVEHKKPSWSYTGKGREGPQTNWIQGVEAFGGVALFATRGRDVVDKLVSSGLLSPEQLTGLDV